MMTPHPRIRRLAVLFLAILAPGIVQAENPPRYALVVNGGLLWGGGANYDLKFRQGDQAPRTVWQGTPNHVAQTARHVVVSTPDSLCTLDPATWKETTTATTAGVAALAASPDTALAFTFDRRVWRLQTDGSWRAQTSGLGEYESVADLAYGAGVWVAVGSDRWETRTDANGEEYDQPATWYPSSYIWWSKDGTQWESVSLPGQENGSTQRLEDVAGGPNGFLAISVGGEVFVSKDGMSWRLGQPPEGLSGVSVSLYALGGAFWLLEEGGEKPGQLFRTTDGQAWTRQSLAEGAALATLYYHGDKMLALGMRGAGRDFESAPLGDFTAAAAPRGPEPGQPMPDHRVALEAKIAADARVAQTGRITAETIASGPNGITRFRNDHYMIGFTSGVVGFTEGHYTLGFSRTVLFSRDAREWEVSPVEIPYIMPDKRYRVDRVLHDGTRWVAIVFNSEPEVLMSTDRKTWIPGGNWGLSGMHVAARDGMFWAAARRLGVNIFVRGRFETKPRERIKEWDGQVQDFLEYDPVAVLRGGSRLFLVTGDGRLLSTDNGEYWEQLGNFGVENADQAFYAEGHQGAVAVLVTGTGTTARSDLRAEGAAGHWQMVQTPFENVTALAYGLGRFVVIGTRGLLQADYALYESTDGKVWTEVSKLGGAPSSLAYGPAGFLVSGIQGEYSLYRPPGAVEVPARVRPPTPIPPIKFRSFGTSSSGSGKYRQQTGPKTQDQVRLAQLQALAPKAAAGDAAAKRELAFAILEGKYAFSNPWRAELWFKEAMAADDPQAGRGYGQLLLRWKPETPEAEIESLLRHSMARGDEAATRWLGQRKLYRDNIARARAGDIAAIMTVAPLLMDGDGVDKDPTAGLNLLWQAAEMKHIPAIMMIAENHEKEVANGVVPDLRSHTPDYYVKILTVAGDAGHVPALRKLVAAYGSGANGVLKDPKLAFETALKLAQGGEADGMAFVGGALLEGRGCVKDPAAGENWIRQAAAKGHAQAKAWLDQTAGIAQRNTARAPKDASVADLGTEVFRALEQIQSGTAGALGEPELMALFNAVWSDAAYSLTEEDLIQELLGETRPVNVTATDGRTLALTKTVPPNFAANLAQVLPLGFNAANLQYYFALWPRTANFGLLVAASQLGEQQKALVQQALAKGLFDMATAPEPQNHRSLNAYFRQLKLSRTGASPAVQAQFRELLIPAIEQANGAAKQAGKDALQPYLNFSLQ